MPQIDFDANTVTPSTGTPDPFPAGDYKIVLTNSELKPTKAGPEMLSFMSEVAEGPFKGRKMFTNLNLNHPTDSVKLMAQGELSAIAHAVGVLSFRDTVQLHNIPCMVTVKIEINKEDLKVGIARADCRKSNVVAKWHKRGAKTTAGATAAPSALRPPVPTPDNDPEPWGA